MTTQTAELQPAGAVPAQNLRTLISEAWAVTDVVADQVQPATREAAFKLVLEAMLRNGASPPAEDAASLNGASDEPIDPTYATPAQRIEALSSYLELHRSDVIRLYDIADASPRLQMLPRVTSGVGWQLESDIALLVCAGRTAVGLDTGTDHIRRAIGHLTGADPDTLSFLYAMREFSIRGHEDSLNRLVRLTGWGLGVARDVAQNLACR